MLYDVSDMGGKVQDGIRFSVTNGESTFHTKNSFGSNIPDFVGLLCLRTARSRGASQLISSYALHNERLRHHPGILRTFYGDYGFDRRGEHSPDELPP